MSRSPKPLNLHRTEGTYRKDRHQLMPLRPGKAPRPPAWLSVLAKAKWKETAKKLATAGVLTALDLDALAAYCECFATWRNALATVTTEGTTFKTDSGLVKRHPAVAVMQQACKDMLAWAEKLGLTPAARQRLRIDPQGEEKDALSEFLSRPHRQGGLCS